MLNPEKADSTINANKNDEDNIGTAVIHNVPIVNDHTLDEEPEDSSEQQININKLCFSNIFVPGKKVINKSDIKKRRMKKHLRMKRQGKFLELVYTGLKERNMGVLICPDSENADATNFRREYYENAHPEYDQLIAEAMETVWRKKPKPFQAEVTKHVLQMGKADNKVAPTLLVRGTGGRSRWLCRQLQL